MPKLGLSALVGALLLCPAAPAASRPPDAVTDWLQRRATPITSTNPTAPDRDLAPLRASIGNARIVGLGESAHRLAEITTLKHRTVRYLVERLGFRSIAWEEDWSLGTQIDDYILGRRHDRDALIGQMSQTAWRTHEVAGVLDWLRDYNRRRHDKVRFFGVEYFATRPFVYDDLEAYIARAAPSRLDQARSHLSVLEPFTDDMRLYGEWFRKEVDDKQAYITHTEQLHALVAAIAHRPDDQRHAEAEHATRQIRSFYTGLSLADNSAFRDARAAENLRWWEQQRGRTIYWAASAHSADVPDLTIAAPGQSVTFASVGSFLRSWYGERYRSLGFTFDHGAIDTTPGNPIELPAPPLEWFEAPLGNVVTEQFLYDLRKPAPRAVREWLNRPMLTRGIPEAGLASTMSGSTPARWFDVVIHRQRVTPATPLR
jgi:erythromycin esterase